jgi:hypothetical protein
MSTSKFFIQLGAFALVAGTIFFVEMLFLSNGNFQPRGPGWVVLPIIAGIGAWRYARDAYEDGVFGKFKIWLTKTQAGRTAQVGFGVWVLIWTVYCNNSDSFNSYSWQSGDWFAYLFGILAGPVLVQLGRVTLGWINAGQKVG